MSVQPKRKANQPRCVPAPVAWWSHSVILKTILLHKLVSKNCKISSPRDAPREKRGTGAVAAPPLGETGIETGCVFTTRTSIHGSQTRCGRFTSAHGTPKKSDAAAALASLLGGPGVVSFVVSASCSRSSEPTSPTIVTLSRVTPLLSLSRASSPESGRIPDRISTGSAFTSRSTIAPTAAAQLRTALATVTPMGPTSCTMAMTSTTSSI
eukprot:scaffold5782_cov36-Phaeocystis_antarctica.AAC.3